MAKVTITIEDKKRPSKKIDISIAFDPPITNKTKNTAALIFSEDILTFITEKAASELAQEKQKRSIH